MALVPSRALRSFERVVVDQIELNVFVAAALAGLHVGLAEEIQLGALLAMGAGGPR